MDEAPVVSLMPERLDLGVKTNRRSSHWLATFSVMVGYLEFPGFTMHGSIAEQPG